MIALAGDLHVFASGITTGFSAVFISIGYITQARYVCALCDSMTRHYDSVLSRSFPRFLQHLLFLM
jgi:hypothetical protein